MAHTASASDEYDLAAPEAPAMLESLRAFGYDLSTAVADIIDNSITAKARNIWLDFHWNGENSTISVTDDGKGMPEDKLLQAMRPGSQNPKEIRSTDDLGRFGLGLKTASLSQCRRFTVHSKPPRGKIHTRCWDLDYVEETREWRVLKEGDKAGKAASKVLEDRVSGTVVFWQKIDRLVTGTDRDSATDKKFFHQSIAAVSRHLSMTFHRLMEGTGKVRIWLNTTQIEPWDPFLLSHDATQVLASETLHFEKQPIEIVPYVLPHVSKMSTETYDSAAGPGGWNSHQGFYVYRNRRLLVAGDWLGLKVQKDEHHKLARIRVDIPNSLDRVWEIDVTKSKAFPPSRLRGDFTRIAKLTRERACKVYRHRGKALARKAAQDFVFVWEKKVKHGKVFYAINRGHPLVHHVLTAAASDPKAAVRALLRLVEETIPVPLIMVTNSEEPEKLSNPFDQAAASDVYAAMTEVYKSLLKVGMKPTEALARLRHMEPFDRFPEFVENLPVSIEAKTKL